MYPSVHDELYKIADAHKHDDDSKNNAKRIALMAGIPLALLAGAGIYGIVRGVRKAGANLRGSWVPNFGVGRASAYEASQASRTARAAKATRDAKWDARFDREDTARKARWANKNSADAAEREAAKKRAAKESSKREAAKETEWEAGNRRAAKEDARRKAERKAGEAERKAEWDKRSADASAKRAAESKARDKAWDDKWKAEKKAGEAERKAEWDKRSADASAKRAAESKARDKAWDDKWKAERAAKDAEWEANKNKWSKDSGSRGTSNPFPGAKKYVSPEQKLHDMGVTGIHEAKTKKEAKQIFINFVKLHHPDLLPKTTSAAEIAKHLDIMQRANPLMDAFKKSQAFQKLAMLMIMSKRKYAHIRRA